MKFFQIEMLFLVWAVPICLMMYLYGLKKRRKILNRFSSEKGLNAIIPQNHSKRRWLKATLILSAFLFMAVALSGPQYGFKWQDVERRGIDIIIALDCSESMLANDFKPNRLDRAKREVYDLLNMLEGDRVGLVAFAGTSFLQCPLTLDYTALHLFLKTLTPDFLPVGGTNLSHAIQTAISSFDPRVSSEKAVILITDGENTSENDPLIIVEDAKKTNIKIFCIGVGSEDGVPIPGKNGGYKKDKNGKIILTKLDENTLQKISLKTGGTYVRSVSGDMDLDTIYLKEIRGKMEASVLTSGRKKIWENRYQIPLFIATLLLIIEWLLPSTQKAKFTLMVVLFMVMALSPQRILAGPLNEGVEAYEKGEYEKALKLFIDAQLEHPDIREVDYNLGNVYYKTGDFDSAYHHYKRVLDGNNEILKQKSHYNLGNSIFRNGNLEEAVKHYEDALKMNPEDIQAKQNIEFVKKMIEQKKNQSDQKSENNESDSKDKQDPSGKDNKSEQNPSEKEDGKKENTQDQQNDQGGNDAQEKNASPEENKDSGEESAPAQFGEEMKKNSETESSNDEEDEKKEDEEKSEPV